MWRRTPVIAFWLVLAGLVSTGCSSSTAWPDLGRLAGPDVAALRVTGTEATGVEGPVRVSRDGDRLLRLVGDPCVTSLEGAGEQCIGNEVIADLAHAEWSPDGTRLVFTGDFWRRLRDPDVWVLDLADGRLENLTDDGVDQFDLSAPDPDAHIDLLPSWSPDGRSIRFARGHWDSGSSELMTVAVDGEGEPRSHGTIGCGRAEFVALAWSADRVAWTCGAHEPSVWTADHSGQNAVEVMRSKKGEDRMLLSFSPNGKWLLVDSGTQYVTSSPRPGGFARVVPATGGDPVPVADGDVAFPTWAPGGQAIAYVEPPGSVKVVAEPGGEPRELHSAERLAGVDGMRLAWAPKAILALLEGEPVRLTLEE
ncbi:PD40 domain-containing protein [Actinophytocola xanthii]|uniref:Lipoprotein LpqB beta-propeller domain-containing protein n=1 Tax=Actinophytocola xanthii TaxID=1912961 RepID=A0A1Q8CQU4_9PSEU|nr:PD40 domain-containing protein [Actinophytocola xanthii]OLF16729.1 hypothetical protein BU204_14760 [Actinophytocola xanthii]